MKVTQKPGQDGLISFHLSLPLPDLVFEVTFKAIVQRCGVATVEGPLSGACGEMRLTSQPPGWQLLSPSTRGPRLGLEGSRTSLDSLGDSSLIQDSESSSLLDS